MELSPHLQKSFRFSRHVFAIRFMNATSSLIADAGNPEALKDKAEKLAFQHMNAASLENVETFVTGITTAMDGELGHRFSEVSFQSFRVLFNYIGGMFLFVKREYGERVRRILRSWQDANKYGAEHHERQSSEVLGDVPAQAPVQKEPDIDLRAGGDSKAARRKKVIETPQTFRDMCMFNASVMGYADKEWMSCTLEYLAMPTNHTIQDPGGMPRLGVDSQPILCCKRKEDRRLGQLQDRPAAWTDSSVVFYLCSCEFHLG